MILKFTENIDSADLETLQMMLKENQEFQKKSKHFSFGFQINSLSNLSFNFKK
jgi:hypothetical protein